MATFATRISAFDNVAKRAVICTMCGGKFFPASLAFHQKACAKKQQHLMLPCPYCDMEIAKTELPNHVNRCKRRPLLVKKSSVSSLSSDHVDIGRVPPLFDNLGRMQCMSCKRWFSGDRISKHSSICRRIHEKKRAIFDTSKQRLFDPLMLTSSSMVTLHILDPKYRKTMNAFADSGVPPTLSIVSQKLAANGKYARSSYYGEILSRHQSQFPNLSRSDGSNGSSRIKRVAMLERSPTLDNWIERSSLSKLPSNAAGGVSFAASVSPMLSYSRAPKELNKVPYNVKVSCISSPSTLLTDRHITQPDDKRVKGRNSLSPSPNTHSRSAPTTPQANGPLTPSLPLGKEGTAVTPQQHVLTRSTTPSPTNNAASKRRHPNRGEGVKGAAHNRTSVGDKRPDGESKKERSIMVRGQNETTMNFDKRGGVKTSNILKGGERFSNNVVKGGGGGFLLTNNTSPENPMVNPSSYTPLSQQHVFSPSSGATGNILNNQASPTLLQASKGGVLTTNETSPDNPLAFPSV